MEIEYYPFSCMHMRSTPFFRSVTFKKPLKQDKTESKKQCLTRKTAIKNTILATNLLSLSGILSLYLPVIHSFRMHRKRAVSIRKQQFQHVLKRSKNFFETDVTGCTAFLSQYTEAENISCGQPMHASPSDSIAAFCKTVFYSIKSALRTSYP